MAANPGTSAVAPVATTPPAQQTPSASPGSATPTTSSSSTTSESSTSSTTSTTTSTSTSSSTSETSSTPPPPTTTPTPVITQATSMVTLTTSNGGALTTIIITSTASPEPTDTQSRSNSATATATSGAALPTVSDASQSSGGLSAGGTIAVAVVVPVASVTLIICVLIWWWRKHKAKKLAEEQRRKEVEEYGFNPNNDPTLPGMASTYGESESNSGYRGWGTTSNPRKPSTNLSSGVGLAMSENGSAGYHHHAASPSDGTVQYSDGQGRPESGDADALAALGTGPAASNNRTTDIHRGPSNASSTYSAGNHSEGSEDGHMASSPPGAHYYDEGNPYYNDIHGQGPYDHGYGGAPPVIRDVQARRNTRIENPTIFPQQGNAGIAQNF
ncbi:hypothetical protein VTN96DRAFT_10225 [Rasamsonia emersonii]|uniref:Uncharacterized protein n=1 Tax=Rasamsonia emersonii (strain ATCC 16479 / CBS 393.64 / IMI 116815) TaxID=1408163 RepID=A0A0F4YPF1_RASE3|nr:hypothetical protein T310_6019 [Rasamsonia emersonii CBS 393.64]KKA19985.1 hypothetical protein T310_6019 [Rasamsonia emersonii CBS 393.64]